MDESIMLATIGGLVIGLIAGPLLGAIYLIAICL